MLSPLSHRSFTLLKTNPHDNHEPRFVPRRFATLALRGDGAGPSPAIRS